MVTQLTLILPTLLAAPYLRPGQLAALQTATVAATAAAAVAAALSPGIGVEELIPRWALDIATSPPPPQRQASRCWSPAKPPDPRSSP